MGQKCVSKKYASEARRDRNQGEYRSEWYKEKDVSNVKFERIAVVDHGGRESTLWAGKLPDATSVIIFSKCQMPGRVAHERSFDNEDEARAFFARATGLVL